MRHPLFLLAALISWPGSLCLDDKWIWKSNGEGNTLHSMRRGRNLGLPQHPSERSLQGIGEQLRVKFPEEAAIRRRLSQPDDIPRRERNIDHGRFSSTSNIGYVRFPSEVGSSHSSGRAISNELLEASPSIGSFLVKFPGESGPHLSDEIRIGRAEESLPSVSPNLSGLRVFQPSQVLPPPRVVFQGRSHTSDDVIAEPERETRTNENFQPSEAPFVHQRHQQENAIRKEAFIVPADISVLPLEPESRPPPTSFQWSSILPHGHQLNSKTTTKREILNDQEDAKISSIRLIGFDQKDLQSDIFKEIEGKSIPDSSDSSVPFKENPTQKNRLIFRISKDNQENNHQLLQLLQQKQLIQQQYEQKQNTEQQYHQQHQEQQQKQQQNTKQQQPLPQGHHQNQVIPSPPPVKSQRQEDVAENAPSSSSDKQRTLVYKATPEYTTTIVGDDDSAKEIIEDILSGSPVADGIRLYRMTEKSKIDKNRPIRSQGLHSTRVQNVHPQVALFVRQNDNHQLAPFDTPILQGGFKPSSHPNIDDAAVASFTLQKTAQANSPNYELNSIEPLTPVAQILGQRLTESKDQNIRPHLQGQQNFLKRPRENPRFTELQDLRQKGSNELNGRGFVMTDKARAGFPPSQWRWA